MYSLKLRPVSLALASILFCTATGADTYDKAVVKARPENIELDMVYEPGNPDLMMFIDFEGPVLYNPDQEIKDHTIVGVDGVFHVFYIVANERSFGYATSTDLCNWTFHEPVLTKGEPGDWDESNIWAPCIVPFEDLDNHYLMFYTGVNAWGAQRTGMAFSTGDLSQWIKASESDIEPFACDTVWCAWGELEYSNFRDPHFFEDDGSYWLTQTAKTKALFGAIALTGGDGSFLWSDAGPMYVHENWHVLESTFVLKRNDKYHLFFTEETIGGISYMNSDSLTSGWDLMYRWIIDFGHAPEITKTPSGDEIFSRHTAYLTVAEDKIYSIRFDTLTWDGDIPVINVEQPLKDWTILWGTAFNDQPVFGDAYDFRGDYITEVGFEGNWWIGTAEKFNGPLFGFQPGVRQGDSPRGAIRSKTFTVTGRSMTLLVGGGEFPDSCWVALHNASTGELLRKETGRGVETMDTRTWNIETYMGQKVYLEIVDDCSSIMGHINIDSIKESPFPTQVDEDDDKGHHGGDGTLDLRSANHPKSSEATVADNSPSTPCKISCSPNPFNPATVISFTASPDALYEVIVFSIAGRRVRTGCARTSGDGTGSMIWDGRSDSGGDVASGVYLAAIVYGGRIIGMTKLVLLR